MLKVSRIGLALFAVAAAAGGGCTIDFGQVNQLLQNLSNEVNRTIDNIQSTDPRTVDVPDQADARGGVNLEEGVDVVVDFETDLADANLDAITVVGFDNGTPFDIYLEYTVDGVDDSVFVFSGDSLFLEYDCLAEVAFVYEGDFDPDTGDLVNEFEFGPEPGINPAAVDCGEVVIFTVLEDRIDIEAIPFSDL